MTRSSLAISFLVLLAACGGRTSETGGEPPDGGRVPRPTPVGHAGPTDARINVVVTPDDMVCDLDSDCAHAGVVDARRNAAEVVGLENGARMDSRVSYAFLALGIARGRDRSEPSVIE
ncbi:MAG: hypothetical protein ACLQVI_28345, partial [Polyangiaceae bacterium]